MATTTTNFGWDIPQSTDLVKDGADAIAALGQDIDTAFVDLKGGTTSQVLTKASGTDLDFSWATPAAATPSFAGCVLTNSANISLANNTTVTLTWDTEVFDVGGYHSTSTNTSRITIPSGKAGKYLVSGLTRYSSNSGGRRIVQITKNGANAWDFESCDPGSTDLGLQGIAIIDLAVGDYVEMTAWQNSGTTLTAQNASTRYSSFSAYLIGA